MMRLLSKGGALFLLSCLLIPSVFARTPAKRKDAKDTQPDTAIASAAADGSKPEDSAPSAAAKPAAQSPAKKAKKKDADSSLGFQEAPKFTPMLATTGTLGLFTTETAELLPKGAFAFSAFGNKFGRAPGSVTIFQMGLDFSYGVTDRINVYASFDPYGHVHVGNASELSLAPQYS
ncbi:MAG: hypothetical protein ACRD4Y_03680, partial [Candidatus Acidiferrales bacterium]